MLNYMVIIMNKEEFIENLSEQTELTKEESLIVNNILENNFFISKRYKDKIISEIVISLNTILINQLKYKCTYRNN